MGCECQNGREIEQMFPRELLTSGYEGIQLYAAGVRTGLAIRAAEQAKWQRLGVILALAFGAITFWKHLNE